MKYLSLILFYLFFTFHFIGCGETYEVLESNKQQPTENIESSLNDNSSTDNVSTQTTNTQNNEEERNNENAGWIEFNRSGYNLPHFGNDKGIQKIKPKKGMFILFPSYVWHGTIPFSGSKNRVSISFDIMFN